MLGLAGVGLSGCEALPTSGPSAGAVLAEPMGAADPRYVSVDINDDVIQWLRQRPADASLASFGDYRGSIEPVVGVGDSVIISIWEASPGGLFSSAPTISDRSGSGSRQATIPEQVVGRDGLITVPYAGRIQAAGRRTSQIQRSIESALAGKAIQPQVLVSVPKSISTSVTVIGEGSAGARIPLSPKGDRVLDVLAGAGGIRSGVNELSVQLTRGDRTVRIPMSRVAADARENILVRPGDVLTVIKEPQFFMAYGATGRNADIPFDGETVTLAQALTKAGGLLDWRSDPQGVFVFRMEPNRIAQHYPGFGGQTSAGGYTKVVYRLNMRDPNSLFVAGQFRIFHRDLIYVSNAALTEVGKILQLFNMVVSPVSTGASIATATR